MPNIILVNSKDKQIGEIGKMEAHMGEGKLHRAITVIVKNNKDEYLFTKRTLKKPLWPTYWDFSISSHPVVGEDIQAACIRRVKEELGVKATDYRHLFSFEYHIRWNEFFSENEIDHVVTVCYNGRLKPDPEEISELFWVKKAEIPSFIEKEKGWIAPWVQILVKKYSIDIY